MRSAFVSTVENSLCNSCGEIQRERDDWSRLPRLNQCIWQKETHIEGCDASGGTQMRNMWEGWGRGWGWEQSHFWDEMVEREVVYNPYPPGSVVTTASCTGCCNSAAAFSRFSVLRLIAQSDAFRHLLGREEASLALSFFFHPARRRNCNVHHKPEIETFEKLSQERSHG